jgi:hypothetical protein
MVMPQHLIKKNSQESKRREDSDRIDTIPGVIACSRTSPPAPAANPATYTYGPGGETHSLAPVAHQRPDWIDIPDSVPYTDFDNPQSLD